MYLNLLTQRATIQERSVAVDRFGQPSGSWSNKATAVPCRMTVAKGSERDADRTRDEVKLTHKVFLPAGTAVAEADRITVVDPDGTVLASELDILLVAPVAGRNGRQHHIEVGVELQRVNRG